MIYICPHCNDYIIVDNKDINCGIFRHAVYKNTLIQVSPHLEEELCNKLITENKVYGCCKPFKIINDKAEICEYI